MAAALASSLYREEPSLHWLFIKKVVPKAHYTGGNDDKWRGCASGTRYGSSFLAFKQGQGQPTTTFPPRPKFNAEDRVIYFCGSCISLHGRSGGQ